MPTSVGGVLDKVIKHPNKICPPEDISRETFSYNFFSGQQVAELMVNIVKDCLARGEPITEARMAQIRQNALAISAEQTRRAEEQEQNRSSSSGI